MASSVIDGALIENRPSSATGRIQVPSTPPPALSTDGLSTRDGRSQDTEKSVFVSPSSIVGHDPPPSTQPVRFQSPVSRSNTQHNDPSLASPPATIKYHSSNDLPSAEKINNATPEELRALTHRLSQALGEARMSSSHWKLQHGLLTIETRESAQRAEVEHQMTRREVEVLQVAEQKHRATSSYASQTSHSSTQVEIDHLRRQYEELELEKAEIERRLKKAKKLLMLEKDKVELLLEENNRLKIRIRENRDRFTQFKNLSPMFATQRDAFTTPQRKSVPRFSESAPSHTFAAILAADQLLNGESVSVPSTPTKTQTSKFKQAHSRGAHSLSSLHSTPNRPVAVLDPFASTQLTYSAPSSQLMNESAERERHDRDSTISISDDEGAISDADVLPSQASSLATSMLRKNPGSQESLRLSQTAEQTSTRLQSKLLEMSESLGLNVLRERDRRVMATEKVLQRNQNWLKELDSVLAPGAPKPREHSGNHRIGGFDSVGISDIVWYFGRSLGSSYCLSTEQLRRGRNIPNQRGSQRILDTDLVKRTSWEDRLHNSKILPAL